MVMECENFCRIVTNALMFASKNSHKSQLNGVHLASNGSQLEITSFNGTAAFLYVEPVEGGDKFECIVDRASLARIIKVMSNPSQKSFRMTVTKCSVVFKVGDTSMGTLNVEGKFPSVKSLFLA